MGSRAGWMMGITTAQLGWRMRDSHRGGRRGGGTMVMGIAA